MLGILDSLPTLGLIGGIISLIFGIIVMIFPKILNYLVGIWHPVRGGSAYCLFHLARSWNDFLRAVEDWSCDLHELEEIEAVAVREGHFDSRHLTHVLGTWCDGIKWCYSEGTYSFFLAYMATLLGQK